MQIRRGFYVLYKPAWKLVPGAGVEPARPKGRGILSPLRLPISPSGRKKSWRPRSESNRRTRICNPLHDHSATRPHKGTILLWMTSTEYKFGAGNGTSTDALSVCFPTLFFAEGLNEGLNFSLVFGRRQRRPSTNFHSPPTPSAHLRATPCRGSPLHRVRVRELSAHLSALHS